MILERRADQVVLIVEDDGVGFDPARTPADGRASGCSACRNAPRWSARQLQIESAAGEGTTVLLRMATPSAIDRHGPSHELNARPAPRSCWPTITSRSATA